MFEIIIKLWESWKCNARNSLLLIHLKGRWQSDILLAWTTTKILVYISDKDFVLQNNYSTHIRFNINKSLWPYSSFASHLNNLENKYPLKIMCYIFLLDILGFLVWKRSQICVGFHYLDILKTADHLFCRMYFIHSLSFLMVYTHIGICIYVRSFFYIKKVLFCLML